MLEGVGVVSGGGRWAGRRVQENLRRVLAYYGTTCHLCGGPGANSADHLVPRSQGGDPWALENQRPAHKRCNSRRGARPLTPPIVAESWTFFDRSIGQGAPRSAVSPPAFQPKTTEQDRR